ncbi:MAG: hypothetical protein PHW94_09495, partial [Sulfurimonas sp.]|nr:hypothetical protein [Sulfurimonas sp.]
KEFCIKCGSHQIKVVNSGMTRNQTGYYYQMKCQDCEHSFVYFYCWNCKVRLIKNDTYWSYHALEVLKPYDIRCPHCAAYWHEINYN